MTNATDPDIQALEKLLEKLIATPVEKVMNEKLKKTQDVLKALSSDLNDMKDGVETSGRQVKAIASNLDQLADRLELVAIHHEHRHAELRAALATMTEQRNAQYEAAVLSQRKQLHRLLLLIPSTGLLSAAAVELIHQFL